MHPNRGQAIGEFEELILLAVGGLGEDAYAVTIYERIVSRTGRDTAMGAVYIALERLAKKGMVTSKLGPVTPKRGGRRKRFYEITSAGAAALYDIRLARERMWRGVDLRPIWRPA